MGRHEPNRTGQFRSLRIAQWNADGINPKIADLQNFVENNHIDVALIQESKLIEGKPTPRLKGYAEVRADRPGSTHPGGGLITFVKHDIAYRKIGTAMNGSIEALSVSVQQKANKWLDLVNI